MSIQKFAHEYIKKEAAIMSPIKGALKRYGQLLTGSKAKTLAKKTVRSARRAQPRYSLKGKPLKPTNVGKLLKRKDIAKKRLKQTLGEAGKVQAARLGTLGAAGAAGYGGYKSLSGGK